MKNELQQSSNSLGNLLRARRNSHEKISATGSLFLAATSLIPLGENSEHPFVSILPKPVLQPKNGTIGNRWNHCMVAHCREDFSVRRMCSNKLSTSASAAFQNRSVPCWVKGWVSEWIYVLLEWQSGTTFTIILKTGAAEQKNAKLRSAQKLQKQESSQLTSKVIHRGRNGTQTSTNPFFRIDKLKEEES